MILYKKTCFGLYVLLQMFGSVIPRSLPFALTGGVLALLLRLYCGDYLDQVWKHPFPFQAMVIIAGFLVTFRCAF
jgi:hypothetical protein